MQFSLLTTALFLSSVTAIAFPQAAQTSNPEETEPTTTAASGGNTAASTPTPSPTPSPTPTSTTVSLPANLPNSAQLGALLSSIQRGYGSAITMLPSSWKTQVGYSQLTALLASAAADSTIVAAEVNSLEQNPPALSTFVSQYSVLVSQLNSLSSLGGAADAKPTGHMAAKAGGAAAAVGIAALALM